MSIRKTLFSALSLLFVLSSLSAQNTNSPYSRYGFGILENAALGRGRAMGGIGYGLRDRMSVNPMNPASYSSVDTLNFVFDFGVSSSYYFFEENGVRQKNPNGKLDYVAMKIPLKRYWGLSVGLMPYSSVGYTYKTLENIGNNQDIVVTQTRTGNGGLNTLFLGTGISLGEKLSLGANLKYIFGAISFTRPITFSDTSKPQYPAEDWYLGAPSLELGLQYQTDFGKKGKAVFGATYARSSSFTRDEVYFPIVVLNNDTTSETTNKSFDLPNTYGIGATYTYDNRLTVGLDFQKQTWSQCNFYGKSDSLTNNTRLSLGVEYLPAVFATSYFKAIKYRFGMQYTDSYLTLSKGNIKNVGLTFGLGLPLKGQKSAINIAFETVKVIAPSESYLKEHYYKLSLGIAFNEMWFFKRKL
ncbi:MAG: hypothetical protein PHS30_11580 [Bacteroidales bacterium]|nr:hypothetical protein [Bacteroidales bacterium]